MDRQTQIERSLIKKYKKPIWHRFVGACKDYRLVNAGDAVAVCVSGGKDSFLLAKCLQQLQKHSDVPFALKDVYKRQRWLKELAEGNGQTFDYYSVQWYDGVTFWTAIDVPADTITPQAADAEEDELLLYLKELPSSHKVNYYPSNSLGQQKSRLLYSQQSVFLPCVEHEG